MANVIIIGGGPAGVSAGLYTLRGNVDTTIFTQGGSALIKAEKIENYYGFPEGIGGKELYDRGIDSVKRLGANVIEEEVTNVDYDGKFVVSTGKNEYRADALVIANGANRNVPRIKNIKEFEGRGVSYCAVCDAFFYRGKKTAVIGNGEYAIHEANTLKKVAESVVMLTDGKEAPEYDNCDTRKIKSIEGNETVEKIVFEDGSEMAVDGVFIALGVAGGVDLARKLGAVVNGSYISVDENMLTNIPNLYAVGDCTGGLLQVAKAVCDGAKAGIDIIKKLK